MFVVFAWLCLDEPMHWRHAGSFVCLMGAVIFAFWGKGQCRVPVSNGDGRRLWSAFLTL